MSLETPRNTLSADGTFIFYTDELNHPLCASCAAEAIRKGEIVRHDTYDEGPAVECDRCLEPIEHLRVWTASQ